MNEEFKYNVIQILVKTKGSKNHAFGDDDIFTQFSYPGHVLSIDIKTTSIAQAKDRIERLNLTFQTRHPIELRLVHITSIENSNNFFKSHLQKFNTQFALYLNNTKSVFEKYPSSNMINETLDVYHQER